MTDLAIPASDYTTDDIAALLGLNPRDPKTHAMVAVCRTYHLDPLLKHVVVIPGGGVYITRDGLLHIAHRSGQLDGIEIVTGPDLVDGEWRVTVSVYRKDMSRPFTFPGRYPQAGGNRKYAPEMALKVAESMALRRAFDVSGLGIVDEQLPDEVPASRPATQRPAPEYVEAEVIHETPAGEVGGEATSPAGPRTTRDPDDRRPFLNDADGPATKAQTGMMFALLKGDDGKARPRDESLAIIAGIIGREVASSSELTKAETSAVIDALKAAQA